MRQVGGTVATDYGSLQDVPARLVDAAIVFSVAVADAAENARLKAEAERR